MHPIVTMWPSLEVLRTIKSNTQDFLSRERFLIGLVGSTQAVIWEVC